MCLATSNNLLLVNFFPRTRDLLVSQTTTERHFFPPFIPFPRYCFATATVVAFVLFRNSRFNFHCYTQREAMPTQKSAHSCRPASLNCPIAVCLCSLSQTSLKLRLQHIYDKSLFQCVSIPCIRLH